MKIDITIKVSNASVADLERIQKALEALKESSQSVKVKSN